MSPPGLIWISQRVPYLALPPALTYWVVRAHLPLWASVLTCLLSLPLFTVLRDVYTDFKDSRDAAALGAQLPPQVRDRTRMGLWIVKSLVGDLDRGYLNDTLTRLSQEYGSVLSFKVLFERRIFTTEPAFIKAILASQFDDFGKGPIVFVEQLTLLGHGIFNTDGDVWKFHRSITRPFFSKERVVHFDIFERHAEDAIQQVKNRLNAGHPIDFQDMVHRFTLDSATEFLFGQNVRSLSAGLPYPNGPSTTSHPADQFALSFGRAQLLTALRNRRGKNWPLAEFWTDKIKEHREVVNDFVDPIIARALERKRESQLAGVHQPATVGEDDTLIDYLVSCTDDEKVIRDEVVNIMIAGRDTTATTLTFIMYMLAEHPKVLHKLRQEILAKVGGSKRPTFDNIREMKYLRAVINETLRLYPPVPNNSRTTAKPTTFRSKTLGEKAWYLPAGVRVSYSVFIMHRRKDLWGPDALEFDPDRFIDERLHKYLTPNPFIFLPFNAGPRICLGQQFAYNEASYFLIRFLQSFSDVTFMFTPKPPPNEWRGLEGPKGKDRIWPTSHLTMYVKGGVWLSMKEAEAEMDH